MPSSQNDLYPKLYNTYRWLIPPQFNIADACVHRWAENSYEGKKTAIYAEDTTGQRQIWSYAHLSATTRRLANGLQKMQVTPGERIAVVMTQRPEAIVALMAILSVGAVAVPLSSQASASSLCACLLDADARIAIVDAFCAPRIHQAQCQSLKQIIGLDFEHDDIIAWRTLLARQTADFQALPTLASAPALLLYPDIPNAASHGVLLAHAALIGALPGFVASQNWFPQAADIFYSPDWQTCGNWLGGPLAALYFGHPCVTAPNASSPQNVMHLLARYRVSNAYLPAQLASTIAQEPDLLDRYGDTLALRALAIAGLPVEANIIAQYQRALGLTLNHVWSRPQASAVMGESHLKWPGRAGSLGRAYPGHFVHAIDAQGQPCPTGTVGMLAARKYDAFQTPDPALPLIHDTTLPPFALEDWILLDLPGHIDPEGYIWPA